MSKKNNFNADHIIHMPKLDSTNAYAHDLILKSEVFDGSVIVAHDQTKGRGQSTNQWESEIGKNLTISVILKPLFVNASKQFAISKLISLALYDLLSVYMSDVSIKWPNDIYVKNKKIAGVLIENTIMGSNINYSVCGIGLNVNQLVFTSDAPNPTSMALEVNTQLDLELILSCLLDKIKLRYNNLINNSINYLDDDYFKHMYRTKNMFNFSDSNGSFSAQIMGVNEYGQLLLKRKSGLVSTYSFKEVAFCI